MPQIKSAEKRVKITAKKTLENKSANSRVATYEKKFKAALEQDVDAAEKAYSQVVSYLDKAVADKAIHANCASRKKAHYAKLLDAKRQAK